MADTDKPTIEFVNTEGSKPEAPVENIADKIRAMSATPKSALPKAESKVVVGAGKTERQAALEAAHEILLEYGGQESNIPINSDYWDLMNKYRSQ